MIACEFCKKTSASTGVFHQDPNRVIRTHIDVERNRDRIFDRAFDLCGECCDALIIYFADAIQTTKETRKEATRGTAP